MKDKKPTIFDTVKRIMTTKDKWEDIPETERIVWSNYMCNKVLSMNEDYIELVNIVSKNTWQMKPKHLYNLYKDAIPKGYIYSAYIKSNNKKTYDLKEVESIADYYKISTRTAKEYIDVLPRNEVERITQQLNK